MLAPASPPPPERRIARRLAAAVLAAALIALAVGYVLLHWDDVVRGVHLHPVWLAIAAAGEILLIASRSMLLRQACRRFEVELAPTEAVGLVCWATLANYVATSLGGTGLRAAYLKKRHDLDLAGFLSLTSALYALQFLLVALAGAVATWLVPLPAETALGLRLALGTIVLLGTLLLAVPLPQPAGDGPIAARVRRILAGWRRISGRGGAPFVLWLTLYVGVAVLTLLSYFAFAGWRLTPAEALLVASLSELSVLIAVTPAGLGVLESAVGLGAGLVGAPVALGLTVAGIRRLTGTLLAALLAALLAPWRSDPAP
ncbi:MAG: lysylphosphatidylglycerol synthase domain-containing protein [Thermoanaerobaculia bacterium]